MALVDGIVDWRQFEGLIALPFVPALMMNFAISTNSARPVSRFYRPLLNSLRGHVRAT